MKAMTNLMRPIVITVLILAAATLFLVGTGLSSNALASSQSPNSSIKLPGSTSNANHMLMPTDSWSVLGTGLDLDCNAIAVSGSNVYVGGAFSHAGGVSASRVAKWDGSAWSALGSGVNSSVNAIGIVGNDVYVGGAFTQAGGVPASRIAKWDGSTWSLLGTGTDSNVNAMAVSGNNLYVAGEFTHAGGISANHIAKWDGSSWSALGSGVNGFIYAMAASGNDVYVTGQFSTAGGVTAINIAKWDGSTWSVLGSGLGDFANAIAVNGSNVYVGGNFVTAGGISANHIAKWDGSSWSALGSGVDHNVFAVLVNGSDVYVGGRFNAAGGTPASRVAGWNGSTWYDLAGGVNDDSDNGRVYALAQGSSGVYVGGTFTFAGGGSVPATRIALYQTSGLPRATPSPSLTPTTTPTNTSTRTPTQLPSATRTQTFTPVPGDNSPIITVPLNRPYRIGVEVGNYLALRFDARDPDAGDIVSFSVNNVPSGGNFPIPAPGNPIYSTFTWRPTSPDIGTYYMTVIATDSHGAQDVATVQIDVVAGCVPYFSDVFTIDYFYPAVQYLFCNLVVSGYIEPDQTFTYRPYNNTTRGQFSKMIVRAYSLPPYNPSTPDFTDVPPSDTFYSYIEAAYHAGIIGGYADHTFHPYAPITRGQLSKLIVGAAGWPIDTSGGPHFSDVQPGSTFYEFIETAYNHGVISGYSDGTFRWGNSATRGQIGKILWQALGTLSPR